MKYEQEEREEKGSVMKGNRIRAALKGAERRSKKKYKPFILQWFIVLMWNLFGKGFMFQRLI